MSAPTAAAEAAYAELRAVDRAKGGLELAERVDLLRRLAKALVERRDVFVQALDADFGGRSAEETLLADLLGTVQAALHAARKLRGWARPRRVGVPLPFWPSRAWVVPQPLGVVGVMAPWNYPVQLTLCPLIGAIAAGNRVAVKPSELTPRTALELAVVIEAALGGEVARTVIGGPETAAAFARLPFDHLLFTGSTSRGRQVMAAAAESLTPVTLELGGKSPAILMPDADLAAAARAIVQGKVLNNGQTCVAPDTLLLAGVPVEPVKAAFATAYAARFPDGPPTAVISDRFAERLRALAGDVALEPLGAPGPGRHTALSLAVDPPAGSALLEEEIFGPILPVLALPDLDAALAWINDRPAPLAVYLFTRDRAVERQVLQRTRAGSLVVNDTLLQVAMDTLPFGGVGASGFGRYHGRAGFDTFSNLRAHVSAARFSLSHLAQPPYTRGRRKLIERLLTMAR